MVLACIGRYAMNELGEEGYVPKAHLRSVSDADVARATVNGGGGDLSLIHI